MKIDKKNRKRKKLTALAVGVILVYILLICPGIRFRRQKSSVIEVSKDAAERNTEEKPEDKKEETLTHKFQDVINQAERLFLSYDYDGALDLIQGSFTTAWWWTRRGRLPIRKETPRQWEITNG